MEPDQPEYPLASFHARDQEELRILSQATGLYCGVSDFAEELRRLDKYSPEVPVEEVRRRFLYCVGEYLP